MDTDAGIFGNLDCNDNTPVLQPQVQGHSKRNEMSPSKSASISSAHSTASDQQAFRAYSPEDNMNNDFFYDEDFSVQFDVNLAEGDTGSLDPADMEQLLSISQVCSNTAAEEGESAMVAEMPASKSDPCLYQLDGELSSYSDERAASQTPSVSDEQDLVSSSDMSDFKSEPLFSPQPGEGHPHHFSTDSLGRSTSTLSNSFTTDNGKFNFDWRANKDQYMLSFDRSPTKLSEESGQRSIQISVTSWSQRSGSGSTHSGNPYWTCSGSTSKNSSSGGESDKRSSGCQSLGKTTFGQLALMCSRQDQYDEPKPPQSQTALTSGLTSWRQMSEDNATLKTMTTWGNLKATRGEVETETMRSKSLPDLKKDNPAESRSSYQIGLDNLRELELSLLHELQQKTQNSSLFEIFQKMKSQSNSSENSSNEAMISPNTLQLLTGTWSMSPASSNAESPEAPTPVVGEAAILPGEHATGMTSWSTMKNLNQVYTDSIQSDHRTLWFESDHNCNDSIRQTNGVTSFKKLAHNKKYDQEVQNGNNLLVQYQANTAYPNPLCLLQTVPKTQDCSVQTSLIGAHNPKWVSKMNRSIQTSIAVEHKKVDPKTALIELGLDDSDLTVRKSRESIPRKGFYVNKDLPDLSFLNRSLSQSSANLILGKEKEATSVQMRQKPIQSRASSETRKQNRHSSPAWLPSDIKHRLFHGSPRSSRESSPSGTRGKVRNSDSSNSFCSSSSSGIDPGSLDSQGNRTAQYFSDLGLFSPEQSDTDSSREGGRVQHRKEYGARVIKANDPEPKKRNGEAFYDFYKQKEQLSVPGKISQICSVCRKKEKQDATTMITSHPIQTESRFKTKETMKPVDYLQVSPVHHPDQYKVLGYANGSAIQHHDWLQVETTGQCCRSCDLVRVRSGPVYSVVDREQQQKPLKSCLVKRRQKTRGRSNQMLMKHRSWSDPNDLAVMKYSQEGQVRYQLIIPAAGDSECVHGLNVGTVSLPTEVLMKTIGAGVQESHPMFAAAQLGQVHVCTTVKHRVDGDDGTLAPPNSPSPQSIPLIPCPCHQTGATPRGDAVPHQHHLEEDADGRSKRKSVSFSEQIYYHSPHTSPHESPKKQSGNGVKAAPIVLLARVDPETQRHPITVDLLKKGNATVSTHLDLEVDTGGETPPRDFTVSPCSSPPPLGVTHSSSFVDMAQKKELAMEVIRASEMVLKYFGQSRDPLEKIRLGSTAECADIGHLVLRHICPALYAIILDGLKPQVRSLFGKIRNSAWKVVEDSAELGPSTRILHEVVTDLKNLNFLSSTWLKFNAFIFALMNHKALDFWLVNLHCREDLLTKHYSADSFLYLSATSTKHLLLDMATALQPLAQLPFRLEYNFEYNMIREQEQQRMADYVLDKHMAKSANDGSHHQMSVQQEHLARFGASYPKAAGQQQSRSLLQETGKQLLEKFKDTRTHMTLDTLYPKNTGMGDSSKISVGMDLPLAQNSVSTLSMDSGSSQSKAEAVPKRPTVASPGSKVVTIIKDNTMLDDDMEISTPTKEESLISKFAKQVKVLASPEKYKAYRTGVTDYQFDESTLSDNLADRSQSSATGNQSSTSGNLSGEGDSQTDRTVPLTLNIAGDIVDKAKDSPPVEFVIPGKESPPPSVFTVPPKESPGGSSSSGKYSKDSLLSSAQSEVHLRRGKGSPSDPRKRWSDTIVEQTATIVKSKYLQGAKNRISLVGPKMINFFDKMLLDKPKAQESIKKSSSLGVVASGNSAEVTCDRNNTVPLKSVSSSGLTVESSGSQSSIEEGSKTGTVNSKLASSKPSSSSRQVKALCHYIGTEENELSFDKGVILTVVKTLNGDMLWCRHDNREGIVHPACILDVQ